MVMIAVMIMRKRTLMMFSHFIVTINISVLMNTVSTTVHTR